MMNNRVGRPFTENLRQSLNPERLNLTYPMKKVYTLFRTLLVLSIFSFSLSSSLQAQCPDTCVGAFRTDILLDTLVDCATGTVDAISGDIAMGQCQSPAGDNCHHFRLIRDSFSTVTTIRFDAGLGANCTGSINTIYVGANGFCDSIPGGGGGGVPFTVSYPSNCFTTGSWEVLELDVWLCDNSGSQVSMCNACAGDLCPNIDADLYDGCSNCTNNFTGGCRHYSGDLSDWRNLGANCNSGIRIH